MRRAGHALRLWTAVSHGVVAPPPVWPFGVNGNLTIAADTHWSAGGTYDFFNLTINPGVILYIDGPSWTRIGVKGTFTNNGQIVLREKGDAGGVYTSNKKNRDATGSTGAALSYAVVQQPGSSGVAGDAWAYGGAGGIGGLQSYGNGGGGGGSSGQTDQPHPSGLVGGPGNDATSTTGGAGGWGQGESCGTWDTPGTGAALYSTRGGDAENAVGGAGGGGGTRGKHGGLLWIYASTYAGNGSFAANGVDGGGGGTGGTNNYDGGCDWDTIQGYGGSGGGGAGGSGGCIMIEYTVKTATCTNNVAGGGGGPGGGPRVGGQASSGSPGTFTETAV